MTMGTLSETKYIEVEVNERVATIRFNRPEVYNAFNFDMFLEFRRLLQELKEIEDIQVLILTGNGNAFSTGADINTMNTENRDSSKTMDVVSDITVLLYTMPKITIAAINGSTAGGGLSFALACDYIIAKPNKKIAMNFNSIGLIPDCGAHFFAMQTLGEKRARELMWQSQVLTSERAHELGFINEIAEDLDGAVQAKVDEFLQKPLKAVIKTKEIMTELNKPALVRVLELEKYGQNEVNKTEDHREGVQAFLEKRTPVFKGK